MEITELTSAERRVVDAYPRGAAVDFRTGDAAEDDPEAGAGWGPERTVRAAVLRKVLLAGAREDGEIPALRIVGARITGELDIRYAVAECAVLLAGRGGHHPLGEPIVTERQSLSATSCPPVPGRLRPLSAEFRSSAAHRRHLPRPEDAAGTHSGAPAGCAYPWPRVPDALSPKTTTTT